MRDSRIEATAAQILTNISCAPAYSGVLSGGAAVQRFVEVWSSGENRRDVNRLGSKVREVEICHEVAVFVERMP